MKDPWLGGRWSSQHLSAATPSLLSLFISDNEAKAREVRARTKDLSRTLSNLIQFDGGEMFQCCRRRELNMRGARLWCVLVLDRRVSLSAKRINATARLINVTHLPCVLRRKQRCAYRSSTCSMKSRYDVQRVGGEVSGSYSQQGA